MQKNLTTLHPLASAYAAELDEKAAATLAHPDFGYGFRDGLEAYDEACEFKGRKLATGDVVEEVRVELNTQHNAYAAHLLAQMGHDDNPMYNSGFLAGWVHAHLFSSAPSVAALPTTQPFSVVVPFPGTQR
ncbi:MAG TPA: hypothetical protein VFV38_47740 [Ktedonobacteraceae bacterium]|nr:hypothetical protein [Ktedonobacteraceae bacterium]